MPQADKHALPAHKPGSIEGSTMECHDATARRNALQNAFDYRGDVTLDLQDGSHLVGFVYLYNEPGDQVHLFVPQGKDSLPPNRSRQPRHPRPLHRRGHRVWKILG